MLEDAHTRLIAADETTARLQERLSTADQPATLGAGALRAARRMLGGTGTCTVTFRVKATDTAMGEHVCLLGNTEALGRWNISRLIRMRNTKQDGVWTADVAVPSGRVSTYKFLLTDNFGRLIRWQPGADNILSVRVTETQLEVFDDWSGDPTLNSVLSVGDGRVEGRQARLLELLDEIVLAADADSDSTAPDAQLASQ